MPAPSRVVSQGTLAHGSGGVFHEKQPSARCSEAEAEEVKVGRGGAVGRRGEREEERCAWVLEVEQKRKSRAQIEQSVARRLCIGLVAAARPNLQKCSRMPGERGGGMGWMERRSEGRSVQSHRIDQRL